MDYFQSSLLSRLPFHLRPHIFFFTSRDPNPVHLGSRSFIDHRAKAETLLLCIFTWMLRKTFQGKISGQAFFRHLSWIFFHLSDRCNNWHSPVKQVHFGDKISRSNKELHSIIFCHHAPVVLTIQERFEFLKMQLCLRSVLFSVGKFVSTVSSSWRTR